MEHNNFYTHIFYKYLHFCRVYLPDKWTLLWSTVDFEAGRRYRNGWL